MGPRSQITTGDYVQLLPLVVCVPGTLPVGWESVVIMEDPSEADPLEMSVIVGNDPIGLVRRGIDQ